MNQKKYNDLETEVLVLRRAFKDAMDREHALQERLEFQKRLTRRAIRKSKGWRPWSTKNG